jgi:3-hexulose-6-phosphate synthase
MKLQIAFDLFDLKHCLKIAKQVESYADRFEVGAPLIYKYGVEAIQAFRKQFPEKEILAETQIISHGKDITSLYIENGADWVTVMAKANAQVIHSSCSAAQKQKKLVMLDLLNTRNLGQAAMNAQGLGVDALLFHTMCEEKSIVAFDQWEIARGNSDLPIYIASEINRSNINQVLELKPNGIVIGKAITQSEDPKKEAEYFHNLCK